MDDKKRRAYAALVSLRGNPDFEAVMAWIGDERDRTKELLTECPPERTQRLQGEAKALGTLQTMFREAADIMKRLNT